MLSHTFRMDLRSRKKGIRHTDRICRLQSRKNLQLFLRSGSKCLHSSSSSSRQMMPIRSASLRIMQIRSQSISHASSGPSAKSKSTLLTSTMMPYDALIQSVCRPAVSCSNSSRLRSVMHTFCHFPSRQTRK